MKNDIYKKIQERSIMSAKFDSTVFSGNTNDN